MSVNDWNNLGRDVKNIVQNAIDTGDFGRLNRDLGQTLESALGNVAQSMKNAGNMAGQYYRNQKQQEEPKPYGPGNGYSTNYSYRPFGHYRSPESSRRVKEAREEFALFVNTGTARAMGILLTTLGTALTIMFGVTAAGFLIASIFVQTVAEKLGIILGVFGTAAVLSLIMAICGNQLRKKIKRFRAYVKTLNGKPYGSIRDLAKSVRKSEKFVRKDLKKMIQKRMFLEGHLDKQGTCLIASDEVYDQYMKTEENVKELKEKEAKSPKQQLSEEVKKVIEEGDRYIEEIRRSNDAIPGVEISNKIYHLENVILRIFQRVEQHPELIQDLHKFMDYYLPTTMKLLNAYEELDKQGLEGENIKTAKREIENTLDTINVAFENLLDSFYKETAWDVSADISVLKTMLAQEGLMEGKSFQRKE
nr:5-bromo-4-chloroindolyl phosphate hydrolysis family protein [uncultured Blautia sp.]